MKRWIALLIACLIVATSGVPALADTQVQIFRLNEEKIALGVGDTFQLAGEAFLPEDAEDQSLTWLSLNARIASVDPITGLVTAIKPGQTQVRATTSSGRVKACTVVVSKAVRAKKVVVAPKTKIMSVGEQLQLKATVTPSAAIEEDRAVTWRSSRARVATVDENGLVTAEGLGSCTITVRTGNGRKATCKITVKYIPVKSVTLDKKKLVMAAGDEQALTAVVAPGNATDREVTWTSDNPDVATVEAGVVTAVANGTATITAQAGTKRAACQVAVGTSGSTTEVTITATGDITIGGDPRKPAPASEAFYRELYAQYNGKFLSNLESTFGVRNSVTLVNLESNLSTTRQHKNKAWVFRGPPAYADVLSRAGVDVVGHANNHSLDLGTIGQRDTRSAITAHGMRYISGGTTAEVEVNGARVGFAAFNATGGSVTTAMKNVVKRLRGTCDLVVVSFHWGKQYAYAATAAQRNLGRAAVLAGADLVVGHHSHVVSGIEKYKDKYIVYGLGTLSSAVLTPKDMDTFVFQQTFQVDVGGGSVEDAGVKLIACSMSGNEKVNNGRPVVLSGAARKRVLGKIEQYSRVFAATVPASSFN